MNAGHSKPINAKLGVVGHVPHWRGPDGKLWAYEPYVRELRVWADLFREVEICSPPGEGEMRGNQSPYQRENIRYRLVPYTLALGKTAKLRRLFQFPAMALAVIRTVLGSDLVLLRSPGHFALAGTVAVRMTGKRSITKWAGPNGPFGSERLPDKVERFLQEFPSDRHPVLVYGPPRRPHQISFLPALMSDGELEDSRLLSGARVWSLPWRIMSVGRLVYDKDFDVAIRGLGDLLRRRPDLQWQYTLIGDGPMRPTLEALAQSEGISGRMIFAGARPFSEVRREYAQSHIVIMPGTNEGWPKVIAEAWAHGAFPLAPRVGLIPSIITDDSSGLLYDGTPRDLSLALENILSSDATMKAASSKLFMRAKDISLDRFRERLVEVLESRFRLQGG